MEWLQAEQEILKEGLAPLRIVAAQLMFLVEPFGGEPISRLARRLDDSQPRGDRDSEPSGEGKGRSR